jgi:hypothetical protein
LTREISRPSAALRHGRPWHGRHLLAVPLPPGYALDASDPEVLLLLRPDGARAAAFSARGVTAEGILEAAGQDVRTVNLWPSAARTTRAAPRLRRETADGFDPASEPALAPASARHGLRGLRARGPNEAAGAGAA